MAFPLGWPRKCPLVIQSSKVSGTVSNFPVCLTVANLPSEMFDADGSYPALSGGGDIRFSSDLAGTTQLACEIVNFTTNNDPANGTAQIWVKIPSISSTVDTTFYVWYNKSGETQPARTDTYGSDNVWDNNYAMVLHLDGADAAAMDDSTQYQNDVVTVVGTPDYQDAGEPTPGGIGGYGVGFVSATGEGFRIPASGNELDITSQVTTEAIVYCDTVSSYARIVVKAYPLDQEPHTIYGMMVGGSGALAMEITDGGVKYGPAGGDTLAATTWTHVATSYNGTKLQPWTNGTADGAGVSHTGDIDSNSNDVSVGFAYRRDETAPGMDNPFNGVIDEVRISDIARSADWIYATHESFHPNTFIVEGTPVDAGGLEQEGFRFRSDDGSQTAATWKAAQDTNVQILRNQNTRLRVLLNAAGDPSACQFQLEYKESGDGASEWVKIET